LIMKDSTRNGIRANILAKRRALSYEEIHSASQKACAKLINTTQWQQAQHIAFYIAHDSEIDPKPLIDLAHSQNKHCYLPALAANDLKHLILVHYTPGDVLVKNIYGIPEPIQNPTAIIDPTALDLVITPLVAFDKTGTRLGMGVGYYDRTFSFLNHSERPKTPQMVGLAYQFQQVESLSAQEWDVSLDWIVTDQELVNTLPPLLRKD
jgi:5-formyltetrahydrofolate cyclo-ligase